MVQKEFIKIDGFPLTGITLQKVLKGHTERIGRMAWSPDGQYLATPSDDGTIRIWDIDLMQASKILTVEKVEGQDLGWLPRVYCVAWSPDGKSLASGSEDNIVRIWDVKSGKLLKRLEGHFHIITSVTWSPNGQILASTSDDKSIIIWSLAGKLLNRFTKHTDWVTSAAWSPDGKFLASGSADTSIRVWNISTGEHIRVLVGHHGRVTNVTWSPNGGQIISTSYDATIRIWDFETGEEKLTLEGHGSTVRSTSFSYNNNILASNSWDSTTRLWRCDKWEVIGVLHEDVSDNWAASLAFNPKLPVLATLNNSDTSISIWNFDDTELLGTKPSGNYIRYTTAKIVLVGDSGVGKTGLGWRLAHNEFKEHSSTHGQQFWVVPELKKARDDNTECEAVLWDLAGQHIYRSIHSIFLDDVDASLVLFDPTNRQEPLKGAQFWLEQLKGKKQLPPSILVGARLDRGAPVLSQQELDQFCQKYGVSGGYIGTSAKNGEGLDKLLESLKEQIPWDQMTTTITTVTFKRIKEFVLSLKEKTDRKGVLVRPAELRRQIRETDKSWQFTDAEMMTAVGHLENHGYVTILKSSAGEEYILLAPELLASVAASIFLHADRHPRELGAINETDLLQGKYSIDDFKGLEKEEQQVLLDATVVRFLEHSICFRETLIVDSLLIFPSLIKQKRPLKDDVPATDDISYIVRGRVENIYATLVVLLGYTPSFNRINQWQNQAQYETVSGNICGFRLVEDREGEIELILYYDKGMLKEERSNFQALFERFLYQREVEITPFPPVTCPNGHRQERAIIVKRSQEGKKSIFCDECGAKTELPDLDSQKPLDSELPDWLKRESDSAHLRSVYETHLLRVKGHRRGWSVPRCYISHVSEQKEFADRLAHDLADAGIFVVEEAGRVEPNDSILVIDSPSYQKAWEANTIQNEISLIRSRLIDSKHKGLTYINQAGNTLDHTLEKCVSKSFCDPTHYVINLFDLVLKLYAIPVNQTGFAELRQALHEQWEHTLAPKVALEKDIKTSGSTFQREIYVSYAWGGESEGIVNEIDQAFLKKGVLITRDKRDLGYKGSIKEFMERIGRGKGIIVVLSDKYLKSKNCMFELLQISENKQFRDRIFPVLLSDANIYEGIKRIEYVKYWETKKKELSAAMKEIDAEHLQGIREEIDLFDDIRDKIAKLTNTLQDMNTLTPDMHRDNDFKVMFDAVMAKLEE